MYRTQLKVLMNSTESHFTRPSDTVAKNLPADAGDEGSIPGSGRSSEGGNGNPLQYSCLENPMDRGVLWATVHGVVKNQTQLGMHADGSIFWAYSKF